MDADAQHGPRRARVNDGPAAPCAIQSNCVPLATEEPTGRGGGGKCVWFSDEDGAPAPALEVPAGWAGPPAAEPREVARVGGSVEEGVAGD